jgi:hypothetical protein
MELYEGALGYRRTHILEEPWMPYLMVTHQGFR